jgi:hypothetical protein
MSARPEDKFWHWLRENIPGHVQRVENGIDRGTPDVNACHEGKHVWIELKVADTDMSVAVRKEQRVWAYRRTKAGGKVILLALYPGGMIGGWKFPFETITLNETYQQVIEEPQICIHRNSGVLRSLWIWIYA